MPTKRDERPSVADLLAKRAHRQSVRLTADQLREIKVALDSNDRVLSTKDKLGIDKVWRLLRKHYDLTCSKGALEAAVCEAFKRSSWASK